MLASLRPLSTLYTKHMFEANRFWKNVNLNVGLFTKRLVFSSVQECSDSAPQVAQLLAAAAETAPRDGAAAAEGAERQGGDLRFLFVCFFCIAFWKGVLVGGFGLRLEVGKVIW